MKMSNLKNISEVIKDIALPFRGFVLFPNGDEKEQRKLNRFMQT